MAQNKNIIKKLVNHRILLSLSLTETGRVRGFRVRTLWLVLAVATVFGSMGAMQYTSKLPDIEALQAEARQKAIYEQMISKLEDEKTYQEQQFKLFAQELGVLQARLERFDLISEKLFNDHEIGKHLDGLRDNMDGQGGPELPSLDQMDVPSLEDLQANLENLHNRADHIEASMQAGLELVAKSYESSLQQPYMWPVVYYRTHVTSNFGSRVDPFNGRRRWHSGIDIAGGFNAPIVSSADGVVIFAGYRYGYGVLVEVRHAQGYTTRYAHLNEAIVKNGQQVKAGDVVGLMGSSGRSTGPHLHFEVLVDDKQVDPAPFIRGGREGAIAWHNRGGVDVKAARARSKFKYSRDDSIRDGYSDFDEQM